MKVVTPKEQMEQRNLGLLAVAVKLCLGFSSHSHSCLEGNPLVSLFVSWHCYHHLSWLDVCPLAGQSGKVEREAETLSHGRHQLEMSLLQPKHPQNIESLLSTGTWQPGDELFTSAAGSPSQMQNFLECRSFSAGLQALCVGVHWPLLARPRQLAAGWEAAAPQHLPWENIPAGKQPRGTTHSEKATKEAEPTLWGHAGDLPWYL